MVFVDGHDVFLQQPATTLLAASKRSAQSISVHTLFHLQSLVWQTLIQATQWHAVGRTLVPPRLAPLLRSSRRRLGVAFK